MLEYYSFYRLFKKLNENFRHFVEWALYVRIILHGFWLEVLFLEYFY